MKNNLFICATHGDEQFSIPVVKRLNKKYIFNWIIGNEQAVKRNKRFIDSDLNRCAPGDLNSSIYEERRAAEIIKISSDYSAAIDIHGTLSKCGIFIILSDPSWENIELAKRFDVENILLWPSLKPTGPLTQIIRPGLELECGSKNEPNIATNLENILDKYLKGAKPLIKQKFYIVTGKIMGENDPELNDFVLTNKYGKEFYPVLSDNRYPGITCYQAQQLADTL